MASTPSLALELQKRWSFKSSPPDPRIYWESDTEKGRYFYRDPELGGDARDGTFVPPQAAPTPAHLLDAYFASGSGPPPAPLSAPAPLSMAPPQSAPFVMVPPQSAPSTTSGTAHAQRASAFPPLSQQPPRIPADNGRPWPNHARGLGSRRYMPHQQNSGFGHRGEPPPRYEERTQPPRGAATSRGFRGRGNNTSHGGATPHTSHSHPARSQRFDPVNANARERGNGQRGRVPPSPSPVFTVVPPPDIGEARTDAAEP
ncbi:hypothetical protein MVEN_00101900 [Mycena venus]|uniref:Uncharacterized protein n=1 Tax=Mycena venus TaxID=2733690 RepID=A0A8H6Z4H4_9AGAR|nr:hypothetical protein MVEN_00101900 [Mycena venus]